MSNEHKPWLPERKSCLLTLTFASVQSYDETVMLVRFKLIAFENNPGALA